MAWSVVLLLPTPPLASAYHPAHPTIALQLCDLYENDSIFDKFDCCINGPGDGIATGSYNNLFRMFGTWNGNDSTLEASRDPLRKRLQVPASKVRRGVRVRGKGEGGLQ